MKSIRKICLLIICVIGFWKADAQSEATFYTSMGSFTVDLTDTLTPITVDSFIARVSEKFYDGLLFHRVINNFVIQGGDPLGNGTGGPGYTIPDEFSPLLKNVQKSLAMANAGPNTGGCQFYINLVNNSSLNNHYTVFGMVTTNFNVVQNIGKVPTDSKDKPLTNVVIDSIRITRFPTAVNNVANSVGVSIMPNPSRGLFSIDLRGIETQVEIVNMVGRVVFYATAKGILKVDLRARPTGLYGVRMHNVYGTAYGKVVVQ